MPAQLPVITVVPQYPRGDWFQDPLWIPKPVDGQGPYMKWCRTKHTVGSPHPLIPKGG